MIVADDILNASILIVDDQEANVQLLEQMLREAGYRHITSTMDPHAVCALHRDNRYDLILLDLQMPGMDGFQVMEELKEIDTDGYLPVLVITAQPGHKLRALQAGAKDFVSKPYDLMEARTRIHNMLEVRLMYKQVKHHSHEMQALALHDTLTGLPNRRLLMDRLSLSIAHARRSKRAMVVMYLDLDGFKQVNDTMGHEAGDILLRMVASRMVTAVRQEDMVARLGGDEFVIALWELTHVGDVAKLASKVISAVAQPYIIQGNTVRTTASIGVGIYPAHGTEAETLIESADMAMYQAKLAGKNGYRIAASADLLEMAHG
jgi:two-component system cell cycle response regulator